MVFLFLFQPTKCRIHGYSKVNHSSAFVSNKWNTIIQNPKLKKSCCNCYNSYGHNRSNGKIMSAFQFPNLYQKSIWNGSSSNFLSNSRQVLFSTQINPSQRKDPQSSSPPTTSTSSTSTPDTLFSIQDWKNSNKQGRHDVLDEIHSIPTLIVPAEYIQQLLKPDSTFRPFLAMDVFEGIHPKVKMVQDYCYHHNDLKDNTTTNHNKVDTNEKKKKKKQKQHVQKLVLLHPNTCNLSSLKQGGGVEIGQTLDASMVSTIFPSLSSSSSSSSQPSNQPKHSQNVQKPTLPSILQQCQIGPTIPITIPYDHLSISTLLQKLLPSNVHPVPTSFETVGKIAHFNLKPRHLPYQELIGQVILERFYPQIQTVVNKIGEVKGPYRVYDMEIMASASASASSSSDGGGSSGMNQMKSVKDDRMDIDEEEDTAYTGVDSTELKQSITHQNTTPHNNNNNPYWAKVVEHSHVFEFDIRKVYWCTRLSGERQKLLQDEIQPNQIIADAFCGVGAFCIHAAKNYNCTILANDWNPHAVKYAKENARRNGVLRREQFEIGCDDAKKFIRGLGRRRNEGGGDDKDSGCGLPDHLIMNYPLASPQFLDALRWWPRRNNNSNKGLSTSSSIRKAGDRTKLVYSSKQKKFSSSDGKTTNDEDARDQPHQNIGNRNVSTGTLVHLYTFSKATSDDNDDRNVLDVALDLVGEGLLVEAGGPGEAKDFLNNVLGCEARAREVRDVAPGKAVVCVTFRITDKLIRHMQGDFVA